MVTLLVLVLGLNIPSSSAASTLQVVYKQYSDNLSLTGGFLIGSSEDLKAKKSSLGSIKSPNVKSWLLKSCKKSYGYPARVKVVAADRATSGLGNLTKVSITNVAISEEFESLPGYSSDELDALEKEYGSDPKVYPDYVKDGYRFFEAYTSCIFTANISITSSNAYSIYVASRFIGEYSRSELASKKWKVVVKAYNYSGDA